MSFDGSGNYSPPGAPNFPAVAGNTIVASQFNAVINDIAAALSICITRDGQGKPSANIDWNAKNLTNVGAFAAVSASFTNPLPIASGGTGLSATPANGQLPIGNGAGFALANITGTGGIGVTNGPGTIALSISGAYTAAALTLNTGRLLGRTTAAVGQVEEISIGAGLSLAAGVLSATGGGGAALSKLTMNNAGAGAASGAQYDGSVALTLSWNTIGAQPSSPRLDTAASGTLTPDFSHDMSVRTGLSANLTIANPTNATVNGFGHVIRLKDNGTARTISFGTNYRAVGVTLPTTTVSNKVLYIGCINNTDDGKVDVISVQQQ